MLQKKKKLKSKFYSEIELHYVSPALEILPKANGTSAIVEIIRDFSNPKRLNLKEIYWALFLTKTNEVLGISEIAVGKRHTVSVDKREIFQLALLCHADKFVIAHNHSANKSIVPSQEDIVHSKNLKQMGELMGIKLIDSIILSSRQHYSLLKHL